MSDEIKTVTDEEAMKALGEFAKICYDKGVQDALIGVGIGAILSAAIIFGIEVIDVWKDKRNIEKQIKELNAFVKEEES